MALFVLIAALPWSSIDNWHDLQSAEPDTLLVNEQVMRGCGDVWLSQDKFVHASVSTAMAGFSYYYLISDRDTESTTARLASLSLGAFVGIAKEIYDRNTKGCFSWKDLTWDGIGLALGFLVFMR